MPVATTAEQHLLRDVVRKYCADHCGFEARRAAGQIETPNPSHWQRFADLGWLGVALPEDVGGTAGSAGDQAIICEEFGRALIIEPYLSCIALAAQVVEAGGHAAQRRALLAPVVQGVRLIALAHHEPPGQTGEPGVHTIARSGPRQTFVLEGRKAVVLGGAEAAMLLVSAHVAGDDGTDRLTLFSVDAALDGVSRRPYRTLDSLQACDLTLDRVQVPSDAVLGEIGGAGPAIAWGVDYATVAACAEMVGIMDGLLWLTRDYLRQRRQYGVALSSLQALQHRLAEMFAELELSRSMLDRGLQTIAQADRETRHRLVSIVKAYISRSARWVGETAIQLHGGIGLASEYKASRAFRRLVTLSTLFGTPDEHVQRR